MKVFLKEHSSVVYKKVIKTYQITAFVYQLGVLKENFKLNFMIYVDYALIFHYFVSTVHTIVTKWTNTEDVLRAMCIEGVNVQMFIKVSAIVYYAKPIYALHQEILQAHNQAKGPYQEIMYTWARRLQIITNVQLLLYISTWIGLCLFPLYGYFVVHEQTFIYDTLLPFDRTTSNGYALAIASQIFLTYCTSVTIYAVDLLFLLVILSGAAFFSLFECDCKHLSIAIENENNDARELLIKCIQRSQDIYTYFSKVCTIFEKGCLIQVYSSAFTILLCVFVAKMSDWISVYLIALSACYQLTVYCILGTLIEYKSEEIVKSVYDVPWYKLTVKEQKELQFLLQFVQQTITITVMGGRKLNVQTGCDVYNTIYSMYVLMEQFY